MTMRTPLRILGGVTFLLAVAFGLLALQINSWMQPVDAPAAAQEPIMVTIAPGSTSLSIGEALYDQGLVRHALVFRYYAKYRKLDQSLKAGNYLLEYGMSIDEILAELAAGNVHRPTVSVTIPEGFTLEQIAQRLSQRGLADYDEFMDLAISTVPVLGQSTPGMRYALEGYLYPDTYTFDEGVTAETILRRMQDRLNDIYTQEMRERTEELGLTTHEVVTLASLVEREVQVPDERELVASVLHNRLRVKMPLQICATVIYALGEHKTTVTLKDLEVDSPYNTYKIRGIPPGPIASPGLKSLTAVLYPAKTDYYYYSVKDDGTGGHYFGRTLAEHEANIAKARRNKK